MDSIPVGRTFFEKKKEKKKKKKAKDIAKRFDVKNLKFKTFNLFGFEVKKPLQLFQFPRDCRAKLNRLEH